MTLEEQRQFVLTGKMYNDLTDELMKARENTVFLTNEYNASFGRPSEEREAILAKLLKSIGKGVHINQGVTIGDNTVIGSGSVITKDIPANVVAAGVPCKVIREITDKDKTGYMPY